MFCLRNSLRFVDFFFSIKQRECHSVGITTEDVTVYYTQHTNIQERQPVCGHNDSTSNFVMFRCLSGYVNIFKDFYSILFGFFCKDYV